MRPEQEAIYRKVNPADVGRLEGKRNQVARDVYSWLCVGTDSTMSGLRRASPAQLAESLGWSIPSVKSALQTLHELRMIVWSPEVSVAYTFTAQREPPQNERHCKGLKRDTSWCPPCSAKSQALDDIGDRRDTVSHTVKDTVKDTSTQDSGLRSQASDSSTQDLSVASAPAPVKPTPTQEPAKKFKPPTQDEATAFFATVGGNASMAEDFVLFYAGKGWLVGKSPMKDWTMAARRWAKGNGASGQPLVQLALTPAATQHGRDNPPPGMGWHVGWERFVPLENNGERLGKDGYYWPAKVSS